jgi:hypothetical protein
MSASTTFTLDSRARTRRWWRSALWLLLAVCLLLVLGAFHAIAQVEPSLVQVTIDGAPLVTDLDLAALPPAHKVMLSIGLVLVLLVALFIGLGCIAVVLVALVPILLLSVALPLIVVGALLLVLLSPLLLVSWLLWRAIRPGPHSTTMPA